jgi:nitrite reductase/ring-hydroxylating ferredoxin subunit
MAACRRRRLHPVRLFLAAGKRGGTKVTCPDCEWQYDLVTGEVSGVPALRTPTFEVKLVGWSWLAAPARRKAAAATRRR